MILQALNDYYNRIKDDPDIDIPVLGFSVQKIHFALVINRNGELVQTIDLRENAGKNLIPKLLTVPEAIKRTVGIAPNFMWDNTGYVFGIGAVNEKDPGEKQEKTAKRFRKAFDVFKEFHHKLGDNLDDEGMRAVLNFLDLWDPDDASELNNWEDMAGSNIVFRLEGTMGFIHERPAISECWRNYYQGKSSELFATCLISGRQKALARLHPDIKGVRGAQAKGAALVSFNLDSFLSYGKKQNFNAPIGESEAFAYTTVLNYLLRSDRQKVQIGDATTVFWTEHESKIIEIMGRVLETKIDGGEIKDIREFLEAIRDGKRPYNIDLDNRFYILGLSPNASRLSIRFWHVSTVGEISSRIAQHFKDLSICKSFDNEPNFPGMWQLLIETAAQHKSDNISPVLAGAVMRSILTGTPYPQSLLSAIISRIRADQRVNYLRSSIIKACLNRKYRINKIPKEVKMALNKEETNTAYRLGRLFAALEKAQQDAIPGANTTIKDRYYGAASATPRTVFPQLLRLAQHHIQKAEYGRATDKIIEDVVQGIEAFPAHLSLDEQGLFALGYYHQRRNFYIKSDEKKEE